MRFGTVPIEWCPGRLRGSEQTRIKHGSRPGERPRRAAGEPASRRGSGSGRTCILSNPSVLLGWGRPFRSVEEMNRHLFRNWRRRHRRHSSALATSSIRMRGGTTAWHSPWPNARGERLLVLGNHDRDVPALCRAGLPQDLPDLSAAFPAGHATASAALQRLNRFQVLEPLLRHQPRARPPVEDRVRVAVHGWAETAGQGRPVSDKERVQFR